MAVRKTEPKKQERSLTKPLGIAAAVLIVIGLVVLIGGKAQRADPTLTAAPPSTNSGQAAVQPSPEKMARQREIRARMDQEIGAAKPPTR